LGRREKWDNKGLKKGQEMVFGKEMVGGSRGAEVASITVTK
jgi:hypothetical protein